jgi:peroxiredoxin
MSKFAKYIVAFAVLVVAVSLAWILGTQAGHLVRKEKSKSFEFTRGVQSEQLLEQMRLLRIGDTIPDHVFYQLDNSPVWLRDIIKDNTVITFFDPACEPCIKEIEGLAGVLATDRGRRGIILISTSDFDGLNAFKQQFNFPGTILRDFGAAYSSSIDVKGFPLNLVVDSRRVLKRVYYGGISVDEFETALAGSAD